MTGQFGTSGSKPSATDTSGPNRRLDSWKEIAAFFLRDERTVKRWEKERSLPVHRLPGGSRARVFAFTDELQGWMQSPDSVSEAPADELTPSALEALPEATHTSVAVAEAPPQQGAKRERWFWVLAACALLAVAAAILWPHHDRRPASIPAPVKADTHVNPEAEELYLKGRYYWNRRTPADLNKAVDFFTQAIVRDPNYAQPYVGLADCYNLLREYAAMPNEEAFPRALAAAKKAVELDDNSAEAHASLAFVTYYWSWDAPGAEAEFRRAIQLDPHYVAAHHWYATFLFSNGRFDESMREFEQAQKLDPASTAILADKGLLLFHEGRVDEAEALLKQIETTQPGFVSSHRYLASIYFNRRDYPNYLREARLAAELSHNETDLAILHAAEQGYRARGERGMLEDMFEAEKKLYAQGRLSPFRVAQTAAMLGEKETALQHLELAYQKHDMFLLTAAMDPAFASLHSDPEFQKLLQSAGVGHKI